MALAEDVAPRATRQPGATKMAPLRALRALGRLLEDKDDTVQVFEIMRALNGRATERNYWRLLRSAEGGRIAYERVELARRLMDEAWLDSLPAGSVGAGYREFIRAERISAAGLVQVSRKGLSEIEDAHPVAWFGRRTRDVHDIWHVLAGYGRDALGEASLVAFSYAQTKGPGWALIALGVMLRVPRYGGHPYRRAIWEGYRRGRAARWLLREDYEQLLAEPLDAVRRRLNIRPAPLYESIPPAARDGAVRLKGR